MPMADLGWDEDGMCDDHGAFACKRCALRSAEMTYAYFADDVPGGLRLECQACCVESDYTRFDGTSDLVTQTRTDSFMEALTNVVVGFVINFTANMLVLPWLLDVPADAGVFAVVGVIYTFISVARTYGLRRLFNGRTVWQGIKSIRWRA